MTIQTECACGAKFKAPDQVAGKKVKCPKCSQPVAVPAGRGAEAKVAARCDCGKTLRVPAKLSGKSVKCPGCGQAVKVPSAAAEKTASTRSAKGSGAGRPADEMGDLLDEVNLTVSKTGHRCPNCRTDLTPGAILCVHCGYNFETGKQLKTRVSTSSRRDPKAAVIADDAKRAPAKPLEAPPPVQALAKMLNQVGTLGVLAALIFVAYRCYQAFTSSSNFTTDQLIEVMSGSAGIVFGVALLLVAVPAAVAANLVQEGKAAGRFMSMYVGAVGLVGLITTLPAILVLKLAFSDDVARHCQ